MRLDKRELKKRINSVLCRDRYSLQRQSRKLPEEDNENFSKQLHLLEEKLNNSRERVISRQSSIPALNYPAELPITSKLSDIVHTIQNNQVIVITGETGSGKTTQIPKMCLEAGRGIFGKICCTQPRRIAATSLAEQVAKELKTDLGEVIGFKIRFADKTQDSTLIQFMTDGILLAEIQRDRFLNDYDTIIIDEAHERTLNIDFLLGYLKQLLPRRPELKLVITSATIDVEKFSAAFPQYYDPQQEQSFLFKQSGRDLEVEKKGAPIIEVSGRMYPVELRYHPIDEKMEEQGDLTMIDLVKEAVEELLTETSTGDILVFMSGVQEIGEAIDNLRYLEEEGFILLPLYGRLSNAEQNRIFNQSHDRKIILSTNIAETSITVPGIRYVIDTGRARISQFYARSGTQGLPIKAISQSSADQRKGRCGRVSKGICIRLFTEDDYLNRETYTTPEIQRSNLSDVILRMLNLKLGNIKTFPFIDPPEAAQIRSGYNTLQELGALDEKRELTTIGREMASLPVDPRTARMILQARKENTLYAVLIIASSITCQDPRERPEEKQAQAAQKHAKFISRESDLMTSLNLWEEYHSTLDSLKTQGKMRKFCKANFLSFNRIREWRDIHTQLTNIAKEKNWHIQKPLEWDYDGIHRSILAGYLPHIAQKKEKKLYQGTKNRELMLFPGSGQYQSKHDWIVAVEIIETSQLFAHRIARINPEWLESLAGKLCKKSWSEPRWERKSARVVAWEKVTLFGFTLVEKRKAFYGKINREESNTIFIREALIEGNFDCNLPFWLHNQALIKEIRNKEDQARKRNLLIDDDAIELFYQDRISGVACLDDLKKLINEHQGDRFLFMGKKDLLLNQPDEDSNLFPEYLRIGNEKCPLKYVFSPGNPHDGITIELPWSLLNSIKEEPFEYLVPGLLREKIHWLLKSLPKNTRIKLVPVSEIAEKTWEDLVSLKYTSDKNSDTDNNTKEFYHDLSESLFRITKVYIAPDEWDLKDLPDYLKFNFSVKNPHTKQTQFSRSFPHLLGKAEKKQDDWKNLVRPFERSGITSWDFGTLLEEVNLSNSGDIALWGYKTLSLQNDDLVLTISKTSDDAQERSIEAIAFLIEWKLAEDFSWIYRELRFPPETLIRFQQIFEKKDHLVISTLQKKFGENKTRKQEKFHKEFQDKVFNMIRRELCGYNGDPLWTEKAFTKRLGAIRFMLKGMSERVTDSINKTAELYQQVLTSIQEQKARQNSNFWERLYCELRSFISDKCFEEISLEQWLHCPRILRCYLRRVERYIEDPMAEEELITSVSPYQNVAKEQSDHEKATTIQRWNISRFRWMLEEYKVSSFAQDLKTAFPISSNRLDMFIKKNLNGL